MPDARKLHGRRKRILEFIREYLEEYEYPPTVREIQAAVGLKTPANVDYHLKILEERGHIVREAGIARGIRVTSPKQSRPDRGLAGGILSVPITGAIAAGIALHIPETNFELFDERSTVDVPTGLLPDRVDRRDLFALRVEGDSMIDALVDDGDIVVLKRSQSAQNGDMVAAWLVAEEATTLKHIYIEEKHVRLQPANKNYPPLYFTDPNDVQVQGVVIGVLRQTW